MRSFRSTLFAMLIAISILSTLSCSSKKDEPMYLSAVVNYDLPLSEAVEAGNYDWKDGNINSNNFPALLGEEGQKKLDMALIHFGYRISSRDAITEMDNLGYRPATAREILAFGIQYPNLQKQFPIIALGQSWVDTDGFRWVLCLDRNGSNRGLDLFSFGRDWIVYYRLLFVCK
ncbi:MAG: hypothetical protein PHR00_01060 [Patescibacteria group bacterium]|nr:hypothetical protein [Patescibacteria group bacterium]